MAASRLSDRGLTVYRDHLLARDARAARVQELLHEQDASDVALFQALAVTEGFALDAEDVMLDDGHLAEFGVVLVKRKASPPALNEGDAPFIMEDSTR